MKKKSSMKERKLSEEEKKIEPDFDKTIQRIETHISHEEQYLKELLEMTITAENKGEIAREIYFTVKKISHNIFFMEMIKRRKALRSGDSIPRVPPTSLAPPEEMDKYFSLTKQKIREKFNIPEDLYDYGCTHRMG